jgi:hypothetical protein
MADKGGAELLALLPKGLGKGDMPEGEGMDDEAGEGSLETAARDFYEAGQKGDWAAAAEALETCVLHCQSKYKSDES